MSRTKKKKNGQTGSDGNEYLRVRRIETRVSDAEQEAIKAAAASAGCITVGQFLRDRALYPSGESPSALHKALLDCRYELNRIGNNVNQIARQLNKGGPVDDEMLMVLLQVQELAREHLDGASRSLAEARKC